MMIERALDLLHGTATELRRDPIVAASGTILLVAIAVVSDLNSAEIGRVSYFAFSIAMFVLQYVLTRRALRAGGLLTDDAPGDVGGFFGLCLLSSLAIALGFVLLIVPGIWLYARWMAATPILFVEETGVSEALAASAVRTRPLLWPIIVAVAIVHTPYLVAFAASLLLPEAIMLSFGPAVAINLGLTVSQIAACYLAITIYRATYPEPVEAVFA